MIAHDGPAEGAVDLRAFAPRRIRDHGMLGDGPRTVTAAAVTLFVDVAGFTPLTERLALAGSAGIEELSAILGGFFGDVAALVADHGGDPVAFGGDALTIVFDGDPAQTALAATAVAHGIHGLTDAMAGTRTSVGPVDLQVKVGVGFGDVTTALAVAVQRTAVVQLGIGLDRAVAAEERAAPGGVVVDSEVEAWLTATGPATAVAAATPANARPEPASSELAALVNPVIAARLAVGQSLVDSHRTITALFARFPPVDARRPLRFLERIVGLVDGISAADGELVQVSGGDKGVVAFAVFGAPVAHVDDAARAVGTVLALRRGPLRATSVGVATGPAFVGLQGSEHRLFATHSGDVVNRAARLMQAASGGELIADEETAAATEAVVRWSTPEPMRIKGVGEPVAIRRSRGWRRSRRPLSSGAGGDAPIVGRQRELAAGDGLIESVAQGRGGLLAIEGEPGVGKSRLAREIAARTRSRSLRAVGVAVENHALGRPGAPWNVLLGELLGVGHRSGRGEWIAAANELLPGADQRMPLLGPLLGTTFTPTDLTRDLAPELSDELADELVVALVNAASERTPLVLVIDDAHELDGASSDLVRTVAGQVSGRPIGIAITRPIGGQDPLAGLGDVDRLVLGELADDEVGVLVSETWRRSGGGAPPAWLGDAVRQRAGGNPVFVQTVTELLYRAWQPGEPPPADAVAAGMLSALLAERFDLLTPHARRLLGVLAVIQRPCSTDLPATLLPEVFDVETLEHSLAQLVAEDLVRVEVGAIGQRCSLRHSTARQVAYDQLSHAERVRLHGLMARHLESAGGDPVEIATHVIHLDDEAAHQRWLPLAAHAARAVWAIDEAIAWWRLAIPMLEGDERRAGSVELAEILLIGGRPAEVEESLDDPTDAEVWPTGVLSGRADIARGEAAFVLGRLDHATDLLGAAVLALADLDHVRQQVALELLARVELERGNSTEAELIARGQLDHAHRTGDQRSIAVAEASLGAVLLGSGRPDESARHFEASRRAADAAGDVVHKVHATSDLAGARYVMGRYAEAIRLLGEARDLADRVGYRRHLAMSLNNEAEVRMCLGDPRAANCAALAVRRLLERADGPPCASAVHTWLLADPRLDEPAAWRRLATIEESLGRRGALGENLARLAQALVRADAHGEALEVADRARDLATTLGDDFTRRNATLVAAAATAGFGGMQSGLALLAELEREELSPQESADVAYQRWRLTNDESDRQEATELLVVAHGDMPSFANRSRLIEVGAPPPEPPIELDPPIGVSGPAPGPEVLDEVLDRLAELVGASERAAV